MAVMEEIGQELKRRREELGKTLEEAQTATKIRLRYLDALEKGRSEDVPGEVYYKGFLRSYGDYLGLDGWALVDRYREWRLSQEGPEEETGAGESPADGEERAVNVDPEPRAEPGLSRKRRRGGKPSIPASSPPGGSLRAAGIGAAIVVVILLLTIWVVLSTGGTGPSGTAGRDNASPRESTDTGQPADGAGPEGSGAVTGEDQPPAGDQGAEAVQVERVLAGTVSGTGQVEQYRVANANSIEVAVELLGDCWFNVVADGEENVPAYKGLLVNGDLRIWTAARELRVRAGRPDNLRLTVNGVAVESPTGTNPVDMIITLAP